MATGTLKELEEEIVCAICHEHFTDPKILPCHHYYCKECIRMMLHSSSSAKPFQCPECGEETDITEEGLQDLQSAFFINRFKTTVLSTLQEYQESDEMKCGLCVEGSPKAEGYCLQCGACVCRVCVGIHQTSKKYEKHKVLSMKDLLQKGLRQAVPRDLVTPQCEGHKEPLKLYCFRCSSLICRDCIVIDHKDHEYEFITTVAPDVRGKIAQSVQPLKEAEVTLQATSQKIKDAVGEVEQQGADAKAQMQAYFNNLRMILNTREQEMMNETDQIVQGKVEKLLQQEKDVSLAAGEVGSLVNHADQCTSRCSDCDVVNQHENLLSEIDQMAEKHSADKRIDLVEEVEIRVALDCAEALQNLCQNKTTVAPMCVDATKCDVIFPNLENIEVNKQQEVTLVMKLASGSLTKSHCEVTCQLKCLHTDVVTDCDIAQSGTSQYSISFTPTLRGRHTLTISVNEQQVAGSPFSLMVIIPPTQLGQPVQVWTGIKQVTGITANSVGEIIVTEESGDIIAYDSKGKKIRSVKKTEHRLKSTYDIAVDKDDNIYCPDYSSNRIFTCNKQGKNAKVSEVPLKKNPGRRGLSIVGDEIFICEQDVVVVYNNNLKGTREIADPGLKSARCVCPGQDSVLYVTDKQNSAIQVLRNGRLLRSIGGEKDGEKLIPNPLGVCASASYLYVTDYSKHNVSIFTKDGNFVASFGQRGSGQGSFSLPHGICYDQDGFIYVADRSNDRVQVF